LIIFNPTKIIGTLGPGSSDEQTLRDMIAAGMDVARLNFSRDVRALPPGG
jgi:pyruvate kinase